MSKKVQDAKRKVGRPTLQSLGIPPRNRRNFNMQRDSVFDFNLNVVREQMATDRGVSLEHITQSEAVKEALDKFADMLMMKQEGIGPHGIEVVPCPHCNGIGYTRVKNGDDDKPCTKCSPSDTEIPF